MEWIFTFTNYTIPFAQAEHVDGKSIESQELEWGYVRPGIGVGYRTPVSPGHQDNMAARLLELEPDISTSGQETETAPNFVVPRDDFELRTICRCGGTHRPEPA